MRPLQTCFASLLLLVLPAVAHAAVGYAVGDTAAALVAEDSFGATRSLSEFAGKWVFLDFCASWCGPCRYMGAITQQVQDTFANDPVEPPFQYVTALLQGPTQAPSTIADAAAWAGQFGLTSVPVLHASGAPHGGTVDWFLGAGTGLVPTGIVIDPSGVIRAIDIGYRSPAQLLDQVNAFAGVVDPPPPPPPPPPVTLGSAGIEFGGPSGLARSTTPQDFGGGHLQFVDFSSTTGFEHPVASITSSVAGGVETLEFAMADFDFEQMTGIDLTLAAPWRTRAFAMSWSDGFTRRLVGTGGAQFSFLVMSGGEITEVPTSVVVPDTFVAGQVRFGAVDPASASNRPAHVIGWLLKNVQLAIDTTAAAPTTLAAAPGAPGRGLALAPPRPNPARATAAIAWTQLRAAAGDVRVLDVAGRVVRVLANGVLAAGPNELR
ncbi:MAG: TlpA disulfide reductase family protein [Candidatus Eisenbacteria bacterium]